MSQRVAQEMPSAASSFPQGSVRKVVASHVQQLTSDHEQFDDHVLDGRGRI